jgi:hypothetical protein
VLYAGSYFNRFEMTIKTKVPVKIGSDIVVQIRISSLVGNSSQQVFVCPLPILSQE